MKKYKFNQQARAELVSSIEYYQEISDFLAKRFFAEFRKTISMICKFPGIGTRTYANAQKFHLEIFKFTVVYILHDDIVHIIAVAPQRKKPGYWKDRLKNTK